MKNESTNPLNKFPNTFLSTWQQSLLALLSGILLSLSFLDAKYYIFAWIAYIPFLMAINGVGLLRSYCLGLISGLAFCISAGYWVADFLMLSKGYDFGLSILWSLVLWFYSAQLSALIALIFNWLKQRSRVHEFILFPLVIVTLSSAFPMLFMVRLGESQSQFLSALQAIEFTGVHGLDAIIALSNIMLFRVIARIFISQPISQDQNTIWPYLLGITSIIAWFAYGMIAIQSWDLKIENSKTIRLGIVQANEVPSLEKSKAYFGYSRAYPPEMVMTERLSAAGAEVVIWSEAKYKAYFDQPHVSKAYQSQLKAMNTRLIFQDIEHIQASKQNISPLQYIPHLQYNTALMLNEAGQELGQYQKMKRIPFGEYVPLVSDIPVLRAWVEGFFGKFLNEMAQGTTHQFFEDKKLNIIPLICYEVMFPEFVAEAVAHAQRQSNNASLLVGLSSNGWFGTTRQPYQHVNASILRAVENRMPLVHAVNNGPSIVALPTGRVIFISDYHQAGGYIVDVPYSQRPQGSYFSQHPKHFVFGVYGILVLIIILSSRRVRAFFKRP
jgi:apolipoprotein N-acyltransferase